MLSLTEPPGFVNRDRYRERRANGSAPLPLRQCDAPGRLCSGDFLEIEFILQFDAADDALSRRAIAQIGRKSFPGGFLLIAGNFEMVLYADRGDLENAVDVFNVSFYIGTVEGPETCGLLLP